jgi:hypothetical protein
MSALARLRFRTSLPVLFSLLMSLFFISAIAAQERISQVCLGISEYNNIPRSTFGSLGFTHSPYFAGEQITVRADLPTGVATPTQVTFIVNNATVVDTAGFPGTMTYTIPSDGWYILRFEANVGEASWYTDCTAGPDGGSEGEEPIIDEDGNVIVHPPDDRVNWQCGDDVAVIFSVNDSENNPALHVYQPAIEGINPHRPLVITRADLPKPMPPAENTWIAGEGLVNAYVLDTGEIQFNIGPTADGKVQVLIFPNFNGEGTYCHESNIYDGVAP